MPRKTRKYKTNPQTTPRGHAFSGGRQVAFWIDRLLGRRTWAYLFFTMFKIQSPDLSANETCCLRPGRRPPDCGNNKIVSSAVWLDLGQWWSQSGSNRRPEACKATALPAELWPQNWADRQSRDENPAHRGDGGASRTPWSAKRSTRLTPSLEKDWWAWVELNYRPHAYQACALTT